MLNHCVSFFRYGRSVTDEEFDNFFLQASIKDTDDCGKSFICQLNAKPVNELAEFERVMRGTYAVGDVIDVTQDTVEFDLAAMIGRKAGEEQCEIIYARCESNYETMKKIAYEAATLPNKIIM